MRKPFDVSLNKLLEARPGEWPAYFAARSGIPPGPAEVIDTDLATTMQADKVYLIHGLRPAILHLEFETSGFLGLPAKLYRYNALLSDHDGPPVHTVLLLLHPRANSSDRTGVYRRERADGRGWVTFEYDVIRVWAESFDALLAAGPSLSPLAVLTDEAADAFEPAMRRFGRRLFEGDIDREVGRDMLDLAFKLAGLRQHPDLLRSVYARLHMDKIMQHSSTYQWLRDTAQAEGRAEGRLAEARRTLLRQGRKKFGDPTAEVAATIEAMTVLSRLEDLSDRLLDVNSWDELLATP